MEIIEYFAGNHCKDWIDKIESCDWGAAKLLADLLRDNNKFEDALGSNGELFILKHEEELISFATLTQRECIVDDNLYPWIGFVFTVPQYRGMRYSEKVIEYACDVAKKRGYQRVYIATEYADALYEKYGFQYMENRVDVFGATNRVYYKELTFNA